MTVVMMPGVTTPKTLKTAARKTAGGAPVRRKFSVALSGRSAEVFDDLKALTDADTDSEVFRNALRLHFMLLKAQERGFEVCMREVNNGKLHRVLLDHDQAVA